MGKPKAKVEMVKTKSTKTGKKVGAVPKVLRSLRSTSKLEGIYNLAKTPEKDSPTINNSASSEITSNMGHKPKAKEGMVKSTKTGKAKVGPGKKAFLSPPLKGQRSSLRRTSARLIGLHNLAKTHEKTSPAIDNFASLEEFNADQFMQVAIPTQNETETEKEKEKKEVAEMCQKIINNPVELKQLYSSINPKSRTEIKDEIQIRVEKIDAYTSIHLESQNLEENLTYSIKHEDQCKGRSENYCNVPRLTTAYEKRDQLEEEYNKKIYSSKEYFLKFQAESKYKMQEAIQKMELDEERKKIQEELKGKLAEIEPKVIETNTRVSWYRKEFARTKGNQPEGSRKVNQTFKLNQRILNDLEENPEVKNVEKPKEEAAKDLKKFLLELPDKFDTPSQDLSDEEEAGIEEHVINIDWSKAESSKTSSEEVGVMSNSDSEESAISDVLNAPNQVSDFEMPTLSESEVLSNVSGHFGRGVGASNWTRTQVEVLNGLPGSPPKVITPTLRDIQARKDYYEKKEKEMKQLRGAGPSNAGYFRGNGSFRSNLGQRQTIEVPLPREIKRSYPQPDPEAGYFESPRVKRIAHSSQNTSASAFAPSIEPQSSESNGVQGFAQDEKETEPIATFKEYKDYMVGMIGHNIKTPN